MAIGSGRIRSGGIGGDVVEEKALGDPLGVGGHVPRGASIDLQVPHGVGIVERCAERRQICEAAEWR